MGRWNSLFFLTRTCTKRVCIFSHGYLFLQISVVDGFFFKAFSRLIESNLRKRKPLERHVRLQFTYLKLYRVLLFTNKCITKLGECSNVAVLCSWARYILQPCVHHVLIHGTKVYLWPVLWPMNCQCYLRKCHYLQCTSNLSSKRHWVQMKIMFPLPLQGGQAKSNVSYEVIVDEAEEPINYHSIEIESK